MQILKRLLNVKAVIVLLIIIAVLAYFIFPKIKGGSDNKNEYVKADQSIAVLPFVNMTKETGQEYLSDGLTEGILNSIARLKGLKVCARTSSFKFKEQNLDLREVGKELGVHTILEGSVQREGDRVRITAQLINVDDGFHFWSEQYDENMNDIFALQDKIADAIAEKLAITLSDNRPVSRRKTSNPEAYELYLKGRASWNLGTPPELEKAIDFFQQAIALDSLFARAYSGMADCYNTLGYGSFIAPKEAFPKAKDAAIRAIQLDSTLAEPHASLGFYRFYFDWDWAVAEEEFRTAISLNQNYEIGYKWYGYYLTAMQRYDEATIILKKAIELDPLSVPISTDMGFSLYYRGDYDSAISKLKATLQMNSRYTLAHIWLGRSYQAKKMYTPAIAEYKSALEITPGWGVGLAHIGNVYGVSGDKVNAKNTLDTLISLSAKKFITSYGLALVYAGLDEKEQAFLWLDKAYEERSNWLVWLKSDPRWASLREDKRFAQLVSNVGLPN
jgi:adenylate cyclase